MGGVPDAEPTEFNAERAHRGAGSEHLKVQREASFEEQREVLGQNPKVQHEAGFEEQHELNLESEPKLLKHVQKHTFMQVKLNIVQGQSTEVQPEVASRKVTLQALKGDVNLSKPLHAQVNSLHCFKKRPEKVGEVLNDSLRELQNQALHSQGGWRRIPLKRRFERTARRRAIHCKSTKCWFIVCSGRS